LKEEGGNKKREFLADIVGGGGFWFAGVLTVSSVLQTAIGTFFNLIIINQPSSINNYSSIFKSTHFQINSVSHS